MVAEHSFQSDAGPREGVRAAAHPDTAMPAGACSTLLRAPGRSLLVEQVEIELLRLEREEVASACADGARLALAVLAVESRAQEREPDPAASSISASGMDAARACISQEELRRDMDRRREAALLARDGLEQRIAAWRERVRGLLAALQLEGLSVPSVLAQAYGSPLSAWPSAASLAQAACTWSPTDGHRVLCARALLDTGFPEEAREWLYSVPDAARPRDLATALGLGRERGAAPAAAEGVQRAGGLP